MFMDANFIVNILLFFDILLVHISVSIYYGLAMAH